MSEQEWGMLLPAFLLVTPLVLAVISWIGAGSTSRHDTRYRTDPTATVQKTS